MILVYNHSDIELWRNIGIYCVCTSIIKELGINITSNENCIWFLYFKNDELCGFCCAEKRKNYVYFKHDYVVEKYRNNGIYKTLFEFRLLYFQDIDIKATCNNNSLSQYLKNGFEIKRKNGKFTNVERTYEKRTI